MSDAEQDSKGFVAKLGAGGLPADARASLVRWAEDFYTQRGEWIAVVRVTRKRRIEEEKTDSDDCEYVEKAAVMRIEDLEMVPAELTQEAYELFDRAREQRELAQEQALLMDPNGLFSGQ